MPRPMEPRDLWQVRTPANLSVSPDDTQLAFTMAEPAPDEGKYYSHVYLIAADADKAEPTRVTRGQHQNTQPRWWPDGQSLAFVSDRNDRKQVWRISTAAGEPEQITDIEGEVQDFEIAPDGQALLLRVKEPKAKEVKEAESKKKDARRYGEDWLYSHLFWYALASRKARRLTRGRFDVAVAALSPDGRQVAYVISDDPTFDGKIFTTKLVLLNLRTGKRRVAAGQIGRVSYVDKPAWSPDGKRLVIAAADTRDDPFWQSLWVVSLTDRTGGAKRLLPQRDCMQTAAQFTPNGQVQFILDDSVNLTLVRAGRGPQMHTLSPAKGVVAIHTVSPEGRAYFVHSRSGRALEIYAAPAGKGGTGPLTQVNKIFHQVRLHAARKITYPCDGWRIEAMLKTPKGKGPWPLLLIPHGGPQGQTSDSFQPSHELFLRRGWAILQPNFRGSSGRGREFLQRVLGDWGDGPMQDIMAGVDWCIEQGIADPKRLMIYGGSYGGFITAWIIGHTQRFQAAVAQCAVINNTSMYGTTDVPTFMEYNLRGKPYKQLDDWWRQSPLAFVGQVRTPTLVITGLNDERVHPTQSFEYYRHLKATGTPCDLVLYPREGHSISEPHHVVDLYERVTAWLDKHLKRR